MAIPHRDAELETDDPVVGKKRGVGYLAPAA